MSHLNSFFFFTKNHSEDQNVKNQSMDHDTVRWCRVRLSQVKKQFRKNDRRQNKQNNERKINYKINIKERK